MSTNMLISLWENKLTFQRRFHALKAKGSKGSAATRHGVSPPTISFTNPCSRSLTTLPRTLTAQFAQRRRLQGSSHFSPLAIHNQAPNVSEFRSNMTSWHSLMGTF
ncbi:hypothetical protein QOT17_008490 [Balamuthia mandrillaris]